MAGKTSYELCVDALRILEVLYPNQLIHLDKIKHEIRAHVSSNEKRIIDHLRMLANAGIITEIESFKYELHLPPAKDENLTVDKTYAEERDERPNQNPQ